MQIFDVTLLGIGLAMDCFAVSLAKGVTVRRFRPAAAVMALSFGLFQAGMPVIGFLAGSIFADFVRKAAPWIALALLCAIGGNMVRGHFKGASRHRTDREDAGNGTPYGIRSILALSIATSIDALATGVLFVNKPETLPFALTVIGVCSTLFSLAGTLCGVYAGKKLRIPAELTGGLILIGIGLKIWIEGLLCPATAEMSALPTAFCRNQAEEQSLSYHFDAPASQWEECFPQGNGRIGLMTDGGTASEKIVLNEISMWSGSRRFEDNVEAVKYLPEIRALLFQGRNDEAQDLTYRTFTCAGVGSNGGRSYAKPYGSYQLFGNMRLDYAMTGEVSGYRRELNLSNAVQTVTYCQGGVNYKREIIASRFDDVMAIRLTADRKRAIGFTLSMDRKSNIPLNGVQAPICSVEDGDLIFSGRLPSGTETDPEGAFEGISFEGRTRIILKHGGHVGYGNGTVEVSDADEVIIITGMKTDYFGEDCKAVLKRQVNRAASKSWKKLLAGHTASHSSLFSRVNVDFGHDAAREALPINERLKAFAADHSDPSLISLYYQFGRYLLISSTRPGCLPPNLQGLWANTIDTPWNGDYHLNINLQMNLWPAESGNLSELHLPLIEWTKNQVESGRNTAKVFYGARGWVTHILGNVWNFTYPGEHPSWGATNTSAAWLCQHLYRHWQYTRDKKYLADVYPTMKESALFFVDMLTEDPRSHFLVTAPTTSPELSYWFNDKQVSLSAGSTMDNQIIRELFANVSEAAAVLGIDRDFTDTLAAKAGRLMPTSIGEDGRILEWLEPRQETDVHHRHVSHLYGLYPGDEISVTRTPELAKAAIRTLEVRGDESTGWSMGWKVNFWARLHDGNHAYKLVCDLLHPVKSTGFGYGPGGGTYPNLFCAHPPFQIDGNFGGCAGIAEMLVQSHEGFIELLPALPDALKEGSFSGLCVRGGAEVSARWADGKLAYVCIRAKNDGEFNVKDVTSSPIYLKKGEKWEKTLF